ncbi:Transposon gamma-delta resolvase [Halioglobus japonicus]|nr:Transposon gamma-delta resolvase [Halioglobus japonicus]
MQFGYARVSTDGQDLHTQRNRLQEAGADEVLAEKRSGTSMDKRPELARLLDKLRDGDVVLATKLDRVARSLRDLLNIIKAIEDKGASLRILDQALDTGQAQSKMMIQLLGVFAEFERDLINARTAEGRQRAQEAGVRFGRPSALSVERIGEFNALLASGETAYSLAKRFNISTSAAYRLKAQVESAN